MAIVFGVLIGLIAAVPLGPVNVFVLSQAMKRGFLHGFLSGATAASLDTLYSLLSVLGVTWIFDDLKKFGLPLKIGASGLLFVLAWRLLRHARNEDGRMPNSSPNRLSPRPLVAVIFMYVTNPTIYAFWIVVAGSATSHGWVESGGLTPFLFAAACGLGSTAGYFFLTSYVSKKHHQFSPRTLRAVLTALAGVLFLFAGYTFASIFLSVRI